MAIALTARCSDGLARAWAISSAVGKAGRVGIWMLRPNSSKANCS